MTDAFSWSISLGRWGGAQVRIHLLLVLFVAIALLHAALAPDVSLPETAGWIVLLLIVLALHELGHAVVALKLGAEVEDIQLWPLGNLIGPAPAYASRSPEAWMIALAGPLVNLVLTLGAALSLGLVAHVAMVWDPLHGTGAPILASGEPAPLSSAIWWVGWFGYLNLVVGLANLLPALPMDGGRALRAVLSGSSVGQARDNLLAPYTARVVAALLVVVDLVRLLFFQKYEGSLTLIGLAVLFEMMVRVELKMIEDGGYYDEGIFGYDFSEGYTSLEGSMPKVRPHRESALKRWRRQRSEQRRQRRLAREAAEEQRMDEILAKWHAQGREALTDEEYRFLIRVSAKLRNRSKESP
jgi:stage IV sporulation protein FB